MPDLPPYVEAKDYIRAHVRGHDFDVVVLGWRGERVYLTLSVSPLRAARSGLKIGGGCRLTSMFLWSLRPGPSRALGVALWALPCCCEHADQRLFELVRGERDAPVALA